MVGRLGGVAGGDGAAQFGQFAQGELGGLDVAGPGGLFERPGHLGQRGVAVAPAGALELVDLPGGRRLASAVCELPAREAEILRLRFGLDGVQSYTLEEIGQRFGVSRERIRQLEARALKQMRVICDEQGLADALH